MRPNRDQQVAFTIKIAWEINRNESCLAGGDVESITGMKSSDSGVSEENAILLHWYNLVWQSQPWRCLHGKTEHLISDFIGRRTWFTGTSGIVYVMLSIHVIIWEAFINIELWSKRIVFPSQLYFSPPQSPRLKVSCWSFIPRSTLIILKFECIYPSIESFEMVNSLSEPCAQ